MTESTIESSAEAVSIVEEALIRVLHVDDEAGFLKAAKQVLEMNGALQLDTASSVEEAMEKMKEKIYDVIVSDCVMPGKSGLDFLEELRDSRNNIPFILFTGKGREEVAIKALNLGADYYFNKIGDPETVYHELAHGIRQAVKRERASKEVRKREERLEAILASSPDIIIVSDLRGNILDCNEAAWKLTGFSSKEELLGKSSFEFIAEEDRKRALDSLKKTFEQGTIRNVEYTLLKKDGEEYLGELSASILKDFSGNPIGFVGVVRDITERKKAEKAIQESQEKFERLFMNNPEAAVYVDPDFHISDVNPRFSQLFGYALDEIRGKHINDVIVPKDKIEEAKILAKRFMKDNVYYDSVRKRKDGSLVPVSISAAPITVEGQPLGYVGLYKDITERKCFEERLSALNIYSRDLNTAGSMEEIYQLTLEAMERTLGFEHAFFMVVDNDMLCIVDQRGYPVDLSIRLPLDGSKAGVSVKVARTGKPVNVPDAEKEDAWFEFWPGIRSGLDVPIKIGRKVLGVIGVDSKSLSAFDEKDQKLLEILASHAATAMSNLEHAKNLETYAQEIRETQQKFQRLFMNNPEAAVHVDSGFHILDINPRFTRLFGYSLIEVKGKHINNLVVPKDKMEEAERFDKRVSKGEAYKEDTVRKRKDGSLVPVSFSAAPIIVENKTISHVAIYKDISQLKKAEKALRDTLKKLETVNEKLRVVGRLTRHDVRNKLSAVTGNVYLAKKKLPDDHKAMEHLVEIGSAVRQVEKILDFARTYERLGAEELAYMDAEKDVEGAVTLFSDLQGVKVMDDCCGLTVLADSLLRQLFYNLIDNSLKYGEKINQIRFYYEEADEDMLKLVYEDDGVGIRKAEKEKIFREGYGKGTGYGLYLIRKICEVYGWTIQETGKQGIGARFLITIPKTNESGKTAYRLY